MTKILVIEDARDLRDDVVEMLRLENYEAIGAENGAVGIEMIKREAPDLILCDIMMPELNGYQVLDRLRKNPGTATIPFIFLTAKTDRIDQRTGMVLGADDYLMKPFLINELLESVRSQLQKRADLNQAVKMRLEELRESIITSLPHELRTPLNTIIGFSDMMAMESAKLKPDQIVDWAKHINNAAHRLFELVEDHLYYARLQITLQTQEAINDARKHTTQDTHAIILVKASQLAERHERPGDLQIDINENHPTCIVSDDLDKLIQELVDNAFKFSTQGQVVRISAQVTPTHYIVTLQDQGRGMTNEQIKQIAGYVQFERGYYEQQGMGLGLVIVKGLVQLYDATFHIESAPETGTSVTLGLKLARS